MKALYLNYPKTQPLDIFMLNNKLFQINKIILLF